MLERHTTKDGYTILIAEMDDSHLINTINLLLRAAMSIRSAANSTDQMDELSRAMYAVDYVDPDRAGQLLRRAFFNLYPYLAEALLRDLGDEIRDNLIEVLGRSGRLTNTPLLDVSSEGLDF